MMRRLTPKFATLLLTSMAMACGYDNSGKDRVSQSTTPETTTESIDTGATMTNLKNVGMFVEYAAGGKWKVQFACDTDSSGLDCLWDVYAYTPDGGHIQSFSVIDLEKSDYFNVGTDGVIHLQPTTTTDLDGIEFTADAGEPVTFDVVLEGESYPNDFIFWMSGGKVVKGAATAVVEMNPTEP